MKYNQNPDSDILASYIFGWILALDGRGIVVVDEDELFKSILKMGRNFDNLRDLFKPEYPDAKTEKYVEGRGQFCPKCASGELDGYRYDFEEGVVTSPVTCLSCGHEWTDVFTLSSIQ